MVQFYLWNNPCENVSTVIKRDNGWKKVSCYLFINIYWVAIWYEYWNRLSWWYTKLNFLGDTQGLLGEKYGNIRIPGEVEASEFEMILDAAVEAKLETKLLEEWYCRDENSVPAAYYLRSKSEMLKSNKNAVSYLSLRSMSLSMTLNSLCHPGVVFSTEKAQ